MKKNEFPWFKWHKDTPHYTVLIQTSDGYFLNTALYFQTEFLAYQYAKKNLYSLCKRPCTFWILERINEKTKIPIWSFEVSEKRIIRHNYRKEGKK